MSIDPMMAALLAKPAQNGVEAPTDAPGASTPFEDWLAQEENFLQQRQGSQGWSRDDRQHPTDHATLQHIANLHRAADLTPSPDAEAIAFSERPLLVSTFLRLGEIVRDWRSANSGQNLQELGELLQSRMTEFLEARFGAAEPTPEQPRPRGTQSDFTPAAQTGTVPNRPSLAIESTAHRPGPTISAFSPNRLDKPANEPANERSPVASRPRTVTNQVFTERVREQAAQLLSGEAIVRLHPASDGQWKVFLRLPRLAGETLAELGAEIDALMRSFGLRMGELEVVEMQDRETR